MRKALIIGINFYSNFRQLYGCVYDAEMVDKVLSRNGDGSRNFDTRLVTAKDSDNAISRFLLRSHIKDLFADSCDIALLYFAGHGHIESTGGYLLASDSATGDDGISLDDVMSFANDSKSRNRVIILDSCHSGILSSLKELKDHSAIKEGTTILTASTSEQYATEENGSGVFTHLFVDALSGSAANLVGDITPGSIYAHIDQSLGTWVQRPVFKTNVNSFISLRRVEPPISIVDLQKLAYFFPTKSSEFALNPSFEPERDFKNNNVVAPDPINTSHFAVLQKFNRLGLVVPVGAPHMWHAAMLSKSCRLTPLGEHYLHLVQKQRI